MVLFYSFGCKSDYVNSVHLFSCSVCSPYFKSSTHQPLVSKGVVHAPDEEPEWPEVLKPELKYKICQ